MLSNVKCTFDTNELIKIAKQLKTMIEQVTLIHYRYFADFGVSVSAQNSLKEMLEEIQSKLGELQIEGSVKHD